MKFHILHLYPNQMNIYGDRGNLLTLVRRAEWHGLEPVVHFCHIKSSLPKDVNVVLGGGGQDSAQSDIQNDVLRIGDKLHKLAEQGTPMLMVCGMYQLFCHRFVTQNRDEIQGIGIFNAETIAGPARMVGNLRVETDDFGTLYGFENHSGRTYLLDGQKPLGQVTRGNGNNGQDKTEGARVNNVFGTYLHGPVLPNNPRFADFLIEAGTKGKNIRTHTINDRLSYQARKNAARRKY